jgi:hypothetical protein
VRNRRVGIGCAWPSSRRNIPTADVSPARRQPRAASAKQRRIVPSIWSPAKSSEIVTGLGTGLLAFRAGGGAAAAGVLVVAGAVGLVGPCSCVRAVGAVVVGVVRRVGSVARVLTCARGSCVWRPATE